MKKLILPIILILVCALLVSCGEGISSDEAKQSAGNFLTLVKSGDFEHAAELMHPSRQTTADDLRDYFQKIESSTGADFSNGINIVRQTGVSTALYDSAVGGASYTLEYDVKVGQVEFELEITLARTDGGFGIYNVELDPEN